MYLSGRFLTMHSITALDTTDSSGHNIKYSLSGSLETNMWFAFTLNSPIDENQAFTKCLFDNTFYPLNIEVAQVFKCNTVSFFTIIINHLNIITQLLYLNT